MVLTYLHKSIFKKTRYGHDKQHENYQLGAKSLVSSWLQCSLEKFRQIGAKSQQYTICKYIYI